MTDPNAPSISYDVAISILAWKSTPNYAWCIPQMEKE